MDNLPVPVSPADLARLHEALGSAKAYAASAKADRTRTAYSSALRAFAAWCENVNASPLPASVETAAAYFAHLVDTGRKVSTIDLHAAAIAFAHRAKGYEPPTNSEAVKAVIRGIRRRIGAKVTRKRRPPPRRSGRCFVGYPTLSRASAIGRSS